MVNVENMCSSDDTVVWTRTLSERQAVVLVVHVFTSPVSQN